MRDSDMFFHGLNERIPVAAFYEAIEHIHDLAVDLGGRRPMRRRARRLAADRAAARSRRGLGQRTRFYDVVIRGGTIYDGGGGAPYVGDVAIRGDRIAAVAPAHRRPRARARSTRAGSRSRRASSTC